MVAGLLGEAHWRYAERAHAATVLLVQLIPCLRLAMHCGPCANLAMSGEIEMRAAALADVVAKSNQTGCESKYL